MELSVDCGGRCPCSHVNRRVGRVSGGLQAHEQQCLYLSSSKAAVQAGSRVPCIEHSVNKVISLGASTRDTNSTDWYAMDCSQRWERLLQSRNLQTGSRYFSTFQYRRRTPLHCSGPKSGSSISCHSTSYPASNKSISTTFW